MKKITERLNTHLTLSFKMLKIFGLLMMKNESIWKRGKDGVIFESIQQKQCYSYYATSLSVYLLSRNEDVKPITEKAKAFNQRDQFPGRKLLLANIERLKAEQPIYGEKLREYILIFLND